MTAIETKQERSRSESVTSTPRRKRKNKKNTVSHSQLSETQASIDVSAIQQVEIVGDTQARTGQLGTVIVATGMPTLNSPVTVTLPQLNSPVNTPAMTTTTVSCAQQPITTTVLVSSIPTVTGTLFPASTPQPVSVVPAIGNLQVNGQRGIGSQRQNEHCGNNGSYTHHIPQRQVQFATAGTIAAPTNSVNAYPISETGAMARAANAADAPVNQVNVPTVNYAYQTTTPSVAQHPMREMGATSRAIDGTEAQVNQVKGSTVNYTCQTFTPLHSATQQGHIHGGIAVQQPHNVYTSSVIQSLPPVTTQAVGGLPLPQAAGGLPLPQNSATVPPLDFLRGAALDQQLVQTRMREIREAAAPKPIGESTCCSENKKKKKIDIPWPQDFVFVGPSRVRLSYDQLSMDQFTLGFLKIVQIEKSPIVRANMVDYLTSMFHNVVDYGWPQVKGAHQVVLANMEDGLLNWLDLKKCNKTRKEYLVTPAHQSKHEKISKVDSASNNVLPAPCRAFQTNQCTDKEHLKESSVQKHVCAYCLYTYSRWYKHSKASCNTKARAKNGKRTQRDPKQSWRKLGRQFSLL